MNTWELITQEEFGIIKDRRKKIRGVFDMKRTQQVTIFCLIFISLTIGF